jgi:CheY-like chemotaxis protein
MRVKRLKDDPDLRKIPVIILTTANNPVDIELCHSLGCSLYIVKPVEYDKFSDVIQRIGKLLSIIEVPHNSLM